MKQNDGLKLPVLKHVVGERVQFVVRHQRKQIGGRLEFELGDEDSSAIWCCLHDTHSLIEVFRSRKSFRGFTAAST